jgi:hypothetical protein
MQQTKWITSKLTRQLVCLLISLLSSIPIGLALGIGLGMAYVEIENVSSFEGGVGYAVMYITFAIVPIVAFVNIAIHLISSGEGWPKRLLTIDALSILILAPIIWSVSMF